MEDLSPTLPPPLSICIITKNESLKLPGCLRSLDWAPEIVVVDDFSDDDTPQICKAFKNVRYATRTFDGFGPQKGYAVTLAAQEWILNIDADEAVSPELQKEILRTLQEPQGRAGFFVRRNNLCFGTYRQDTYPGQLRLFKKAAGNFNNRAVHERVEIQGETGQLQSFLEHRPRSYKNFQQHYKTYAVKYGRLAAQDYLAWGERVTVANAVWKIVFLPLAAFIREYFLKRKCRQGKTGLYVSLCSALCYHIAYRRLIALQSIKTVSPCQVSPDEYSSEYFLHHRGGSDEFIKSKGKQLCDSHAFALSLAHLRPTDDVLDFGCGCGEISLNAAQTAKSVLGVDYSGDAIALAGEAKSVFPPDVGAKTIFQQADIETYSIPVEQFDVIFFLDVIEHLDRSRIDPVMTRLYHSLKKGGRIIVHTWPNRWHRQITYPLLVLMGKLAGSTRPKNPRSRYEEIMHVSEQSPWELKSHLKAAGFKTSDVFLRHNVPFGRSPGAWIHWIFHALPPFKWFFCDNIWGKASK